MSQAPGSLGFPVCSIAPPHVLAHLASKGTDEQRDAALRALASAAATRGRRAISAHLLATQPLTIQSLPGMSATAGEKRTVYDARHGGESSLPGKKVRGEGDPASKDAAVNEAYDGADSTYRFYKEVFGRESINGSGMEMISSVHFETDLDNAMWDGGQMLYGDGSGQLFKKGSLTKALDVIGHEFTHGVTQFTAALNYSRQAGALNESFSDVFGTLIKQWKLGQTADQADWLIGVGTLAPSVKGQALRSMKAPGTAFEFDNQPADMSAYQDLPDDSDPRNDNGGVHINSGIPNRAFYLAATAIGGNAWEKAGKIWFVTLTEKLGPNTDFTIAANATIKVAEELFGSGDEAKAVEEAWKTVKVL